MTLTIRRYVPPPAPPLVFLGAWDPAMAYSPGWIVQSGTSLYQCIGATAPGDDPTAPPADPPLYLWYQIYAGP